MITAMKKAWLLACLLGCPSEPRRDKHEFYGITYTVPAGSSLANTGNSLPGPEPEPEPLKPGEEPKPVPPPYIHPGVSVNEVGVEIWKDPSATTLEGMKFSLTPHDVLKIDAAIARADGWDLTYTWKGDDGTTSQIVTRYYQFGDEQYSCKYYSTFSKMAEAERTCRSIRPITKKK